MDKNSHVDRLITVREAMHLLGVGSTTFYKFCREGKVKPIKFSRRCTRFRMSEITAFIDDVQKGDIK
jgi:excisionase family DNA binding protein